jgi:hypothetical protein
MINMSVLLVQMDRLKFTISIKVIFILIFFFLGKLLTVGNTSRLTGFPCTGFKWKPKTE